MKVKDIKKIIAVAGKDIAPLKKKREKFENKLKNGRSYLKKIKEKIVIYKSIRKK